MIIFLYGKDTYRSRRKVREMMEKFKQDRDPQGLNVVRVDATKLEPGQLLEEMLATPFLAEKRMVVVEHLLSCKDKDLQQAALTRIEEKGFPDTNAIVFWEPDGTYRSKVAKALFARLKKEKYASEFEQLEGAQLAAWISSEVKERGGAIARTAAFTISQQLSDMWQVSSLIDQLVAYRNGEEISQDDVERFAPAKVDDNIFNLVDAIVGKRPQQVFSQIHEQYRLGKDAGYVFAMILRQYRIMLHIRDVMDRGINPDPKELGLHAFVVKKTMPLVRQYSMQQLMQIHNDLLDIDIQTKTGGLNQQLLLELFVAKVSV